MFRKINKLSQIIKHIRDNRIFLRNDFNVPLNGDRIMNDFRIKSSLPTIEAVLKNDPKCLIMASHLGRPNGQVDVNYSLKPIVKELSQLLGKRVELVRNFVEQEQLAKINDSKSGQIFLLENLRFYKEEEGKFKDKNKNKILVDKNEIQKFREKLSSMSDVYINDAFGTIHRAHSSIVGVKTEIKAAGLLVEKEIKYFGKALENPGKKFVVVLGGAKISDKISLISNLLDKASDIIIGGAMAFTFLKYIQKVKIGNSIFDPNSQNLVRDIYQKAKQNNVNIHLPIDYIGSKSLQDENSIKYFTNQTGIDDEYQGYDIGRESIKKFKTILNDSTTVVMNGPMGVFENHNYQEGSRAIVEYIAGQNNCTSIVGGGDSVTLVDKFNFRDKLSHVSTGGGASLDLLSGKILPGLKYLMS